ncbi:MAG: hypothetical protein N2508_00970 [Anaerolineae bacterium]|nr:hypothetical protein [Anaerolineae bacterium]
MRQLWHRVREWAIVFSFIVNLVMVLALLVLSLPALQLIFALKNGLIEPMLVNLDTAFVGLGEATIHTTVQIDETIPIQFALPLDQPLPIEFQLPIEQDTVVTLNAPVPLNVPAQFVLPGGGGAINGTVFLYLPAGMQLPVHLTMVVPVSQTIPVRMSVPVNQEIPVRMNVPVTLKLGEAGLAPVVSELRGAIRPVKEQMERLPDGIKLP